MTRSFLLLSCVLAALAGTLALGEEPHKAGIEGLLSSGTRLMVFSPHPDDETLGAGGLLQRVLSLGGAAKVVFMTSGDGYPEGVELEDRIQHPSAKDYRAYGKEREKEARQVLETLGMKEKDILFLGFPDGGLCKLAAGGYTSPEHPYRSPYTERDRPPPTERVLPRAKYDREDLIREVTRLLQEFHPNLLAFTRKEDAHPDHCSTYVFVHEALIRMQEKHPAYKPTILNFLIHYGQWPIGEESGTGSRLLPPKDFPDRASIEFALKPAETERKRRALLQYSSQMLIMGRYLMSFARSNELFWLEPLRSKEEIEEARCCW